MINPTLKTHLLGLLGISGSLGMATRRPTAKDRRKAQSNEDATRAAVAAEWRRIKKAEKLYAAHLKCINNNPCLSQEQKERMLS